MKLESFSKSFFSIIEQKHCHIIVRVSCQQWQVNCTFRIEVDESTILESIKSNLFYFTDKSGDERKIEAIQTLLLGPNLPALENFLSRIKKNSFRIFGSASADVERFLEEVFAQYRIAVPFVASIESKMPNIFFERDKIDQLQLEKKSSIGSFVSKL